MPRAPYKLKIYPDANIKGVNQKRLKALIDLASLSWAVCPFDTEDFLSMVKRAFGEEHQKPNVAYCHKGHSLIGGNLKIITKRNGKIEHRCLTCHSVRQRRYHLNKREKLKCLPLPV